MGLGLKEAEAKALDHTAHKKCSSTKLDSLRRNIGVLDGRRLAKRWSSRLLFNGDNGQPCKAEGLDAPPNRPRRVSSIADNEIVNVVFPVTHCQSYQVESLQNAVFPLSRNEMPTTKVSPFWDVSKGVDTPPRRMIRLSKVDQAPRMTRPSYIRNESISALASMAHIRINESNTGQVSEPVDQSKPC